MDNILIDKLCDIQGKLFALATINEVDSIKFINAFMNSEIASLIDQKYPKYLSVDEKYIFEEIYKTFTGYKIRKMYLENEMYWMGYMYRYISIHMNVSSHILVEKINGTAMYENYTKYMSINPAVVMDLIFK